MYAKNYYEFVYKWKKKLVLVQGNCFSAPKLVHAKLDWIEEIKLQMKWFIGITNGPIFNNLAIWIREKGKDPV